MDSEEQLHSISDRAIEAGHSKELKTLADELDKKLTAVEDQIIQNKAESSQDNINYPRVFTNHIGRLYGVVVYAHHRPTGGALERYKDLKVEYAGIVADYKDVMENEVPKFNDLLVKEKVARVIVLE